MVGSIIHVGINFVTQNLGQAISGMKEMSNTFNEAHRQANIFANGMDTVANKTLASSNRIRKALQVDWSSEFKRQQSFFKGQINANEKALEAITRSFDNQWREIANKYQSLVMGSVALSMAGLGLQNVGGNIGGFLGKAVDTATEYELVMKQIAFYGREALKTDEDRARLNKEIFQLGRDLPVTTTEIANSMLAAMKTGYDDLDDAISMGTEASKLQFMSLNKLKGEDSLKFANLARQLDGRSATDMGGLTDMLLKTADVSALDPEGLFRAMMSTRAAKMNLDMDMPTFLALIGGMGNVLNERGAGQSLNVFSRGTLQAFGSKPKSNRGQLWNALGIDLDKDGDDMIKVIDKVIDQSHKLWGDTATRRQNLMDIFGNDALTLLSAYETNRKNSGLTMSQMRDDIKASDGSGYSQKAIDAIRNSMYGLREQLKSVKEQFFILFGLSMAPGFTLLLKQITRVIGGVNQFLETHPKIASFIGYFLGLTAAVAVAAGGLLIFGGLIVGTYSSIMAFATNMIRTTKVANLLGTGIASVGQAMGGQFIGPVKKGLGLITKLAVGTGLLYLAWKYDFLGLRTQTTKFVSNLQTSFGNARKTMDLFRNGSVADFKASFEALGEGGFWGKVSQGLVRFGTLVAGIFEAWNDNTISKDMHDKLEAAGMLKALGLVLDVKAAVTDLWKGFVTGIKAGAEILWPLIKPLWDFVKWSYEKITGILEHFGFLENINNGISSKWETMGESLGLIVGGLVGIKLGVKLWSLALMTPLKMLLRMVTLFKTIGKFGGWFRGGGPGRMAMGGARLVGRGVKNTGGWVFGNKQTRQAHALGQQYYRNKNTFVPKVDGKNLPTDFHTNPNTPENKKLRKDMWNSDRYGGKVVVSKPGRVDTVRGRGIFGRIGDVFRGRERMVQQAANGRLYETGQSKTGSKTSRFLSKTETETYNKKGSLRKGGISGFWQGWSGFSNRNRITATGSLGGGKGGGFGKGLMNGIGNLFKGGFKGMGRLGATAGKGLLKGIGGVLTKGLPFVFKVGFRAIPFLGWALMAWDVISMVFSNWDGIKTGAAKAWNWIKNDGMMYLGQFFSWLWNTALPAAWAGIQAGFKAAWNWARTDGIMYLGQFLSWLWNTALPAMWTGIQTGFKAAWNWARTDGVKLLGQFFTWLWKEGLPAAGQGLINVFLKTWNFIKDSGVNILSKVGEGLWTSFKSVGTSISNMFNTLWSWIKDFFTFEVKIPDWVPHYGGNVYRIGLDGASQIGGDPMAQYNKVQGGGGGKATYMSSHVGSKVTDEGLVNVAPGEVILRHDTVRDFEAYVKNAKKAKPESGPAPSPGPSNITFAPGSVVIHMANASSGEVQRGAREMFEEFKRLVEKENIRTYRPARGKG